MCLLLFVVLVFVVLGPLIPLVAVVKPLPVLVLVEHLSLREHGIN
jgi:hypothetical protein